VQKEENNGDKSKEILSVTSSAKASMLFESMSQNSDLNFFLGSNCGVSREGIVDGDSRKESFLLTDNSTMSKEPTKPAAVPMAPTQPFTVLKEPTEPDMLKEPLVTLSLFLSLEVAAKLTINTLSLSQLLFIRNNFMMCSFGMIVVVLFLRIIIG
jgi:hypothetical protein